ncbi:hypothetical protein ABBQ38_006822 [Trebouxia sp. C0009 RCD-2024]
MEPKLPRPGGLVRAAHQANGPDTARIVLGALAVGGGSLLFRNFQQRRKRHSDVEQALRAATACNDALRAEKLVLEKALEEAQGQLAVAQAAEEEGKRQAVDAQEQHAQQAQQLQADVGRLQQQLQGLERALTEKDTVIQRLHDQEWVLTDRVTSLSGQVDGLQQQLADSSVEVARLSGDLHSATETHDQAVQALEVEMTELREQHQTAAGAAAVQVELLQSQLTEKDGALASLREQLASAEQTQALQVTDLSQVDSLHQQLADSSAEVISLTADLTTAKKTHVLALQDRDVEIKGLKEQVVQQQSAALQDKEAYSRVVQENMELRRQAQTLKGRLVTVELNVTGAPGSPTPGASTPALAGDGAVGDKAPVILGPPAGLNTVNPTIRSFTVPSCEGMPVFDHEQKLVSTSPAAVAAPALGPINSSKGMKPVSSGTASQEGMGMSRASDAAAPTPLSCSGGGLSREQQAQLAAKIIARLRKAKGIKATECAPASPSSSSATSKEGLGSSRGPDVAASSTGPSCIGSGLSRQQQAQLAVNLIKRRQQTIAEGSAKLRQDKSSLQNEGSMFDNGETVVRTSACDGAVDGGAPATDLAPADLAPTSSTPKEHFILRSCKDMSAFERQLVSTCPAPALGPLKSSKAQKLSKKAFRSTGSSQLTCQMDSGEARVVANAIDYTGNLIDSAHSMRSAGNTQVCEAGQTVARVLPRDGANSKAPAMELRMPAGLTPTLPTPQEVSTLCKSKGMLVSGQKLVSTLDPLKSSKAQTPLSTASQEGMGIFKALDAGAPTRLSCSGGGLSREQQAQLAAKIIQRLQKAKGMEPTGSASALPTSSAGPDGLLSTCSKHIRPCSVQGSRLPSLNTHEADVIAPKPSCLPRMLPPSPNFFARVSQLASPTWDAEAREKVASEQGTGSGPWDGTFSMVQADFHDSIRVLASEALGLIGSGSQGTLIYGEAVLDGVGLVPLAIKKINVSSAADEAAVLGEVDALKAVIGKDHMIQLVDFKCAEDKRAFYIVTRFEEGRMLGDVFIELAVAARVYPSQRPKHLAAVKLAFKQILQAVKALHEQGYAHVDIKALNIHIRDWEDLARLHITVLDLGSSLKRDAGRIMKQNPGKHLRMWPVTVAALVKGLCSSHCVLVRRRNATSSHMRVRKPATAQA